MSSPYHDDDLGDDPGKPEAGAPLWEYWLMVAVLAIAYGLVIVGLGR